jgi:hypothetical protein
MLCRLHTMPHLAQLYLIWIKALPDSCFKATAVGPAPSAVNPSLSLSWW